MFEPWVNVHAANRLRQGENSLEGAISSTGFPCTAAARAVALAQVRRVCTPVSLLSPKQRCPKTTWEIAISDSGNRAGNRAPSFALGVSLPAISRAGAITLEGADRGASEAGLQKPPSSPAAHICFPSSLGGHPLEMQGGGGLTHAQVPREVASLSPPGLWHCMQGEKMPAGLAARGKGAGCEGWEGCKVLACLYHGVQRDRVAAGLGVRVKGACRGGCKLKE